MHITFICTGNTCRSPMAEGIARKIIEEKYPEYIPAWDRCMKSRKVHLCNMMVMRRDFLDPRFP